MGSADKSALVFDDFILELQPASLRRSGKIVSLQSQPLRLLALLASRHGDLVTHDDIRKHLWGDVDVDSSSRMHVCIRQIRGALQDDGEPPKFIETIPRKGYRFVADVAPAQAKPGSLDATGRSRLFVAFVAVLISSLAIGIWVSMRNPTTRSTDSEIGTVSMDDAYLEGQALLDSGSEQDARRARDLFELAIRADPNFAPAYASMSKAFASTRDYDKAREFALKAIQSDGTYAEAYLRLAAAESGGFWNWQASEEAIEQALALVPGSSSAHYALAGNYLVTGRMDRGLKEMQIALQSSPASTELLTQYGTFLYYDRQSGEARAQCAEVLEVDADDYAARHCLYQVALAERDFEKALRHAAVLMRLSGAQPEDIAAVTASRFQPGIESFERWQLDRLERRAESEATSPLLFASSLAVLGKYDEALFYLIKGHDERYPMTPFVMLDPIFIPLRHQTRFKALANEMGVRFPTAS